MAGTFGGTGFDTDVLIVGAGPTGLALARELHTLGVAAQIVDRAPDAAHESRAMAIQARTLEVLARNRLADDLVSAGNPSATLVLHRRGARPPGRARTVPLFDEALGDTRYPFLLFLSQAATERVFVDRLAAAGVGIRRGLTLTGLHQDEHGVTCTLESPGVSARVVRARYVVGCDGAHSMTRHLAGIGFTGRAYPHRFLLADLEADGPEPGRVHVYLSRSGPLFLFPLVRPASWRLLVMLPSAAHDRPVSLSLAQTAVSRHTRDPIVLHDPVWLTDFTVSSRLADAFQRGRVFLAGDAAHIHSPAGAQGMNTGIQDAVNLGWKLALACRGEGGPELLRSYEQERRPVARSVLTMTDRAFTVATAQTPVLSDLRAGPGVRLAELLLRDSRVRRAGFRVISELDIDYRGGPLSVEGRPRPAHGPRAGERYPQPGITQPGITPPGIALPEITPPEVAEPRITPPVPAEPLHAPTPRRPPLFRMLLCGPATLWPDADLCEFEKRWAHLVSVERVPAAPRSRWSAAPRAAANSRRRPGTAQYLVRWDGYVGYRCAGADLVGAAQYLRMLGARPTALDREPLTSS